MKRARMDLQFVEPGVDRDLVRLYIEWLMIRQAEHHALGAARDTVRGAWRAARRHLRHAPYPFTLAAVDTVLMFIVLAFIPPVSLFPAYALPVVWAGVYALSFTLTAVLPVGSREWRAAHWL